MIVVPLRRGVALGIVSLLIILALSAFVWRNQHRVANTVDVAGVGQNAVDTSTNEATFSGEVVRMEGDELIVRDAGGELAFTLSEQTPIRSSSDPEASLDRAALKPELMVAVSFAVGKVAPPIPAVGVMIIADTATADPCQQDESTEGCVKAPTLVEFVGKATDEQRRCVEQGMGKQFTAQQETSMRQLSSEAMKSISDCFPPSGAPAEEQQ